MFQLVCRFVCLLLLRVKWFLIFLFVGCLSCPGFILGILFEMFSMRYANMFVFLVFLSSGLTVCYSFLLFYLLYVVILILFLPIRWLRLAVWYG